MVLLWECGNCSNFVFSTPFPLGTSIPPTQTTWGGPLLVLPILNYVTQPLQDNPGFSYRHSYVLIFLGASKRSSFLFVHHTSMCCVTTHNMRFVRFRFKSLTHAADTCSVLGVSRPENAGRWQSAKRSVQFSSFICYFCFE